MNECDVCQSTVDIVAGRWIFYCPEHKSVDHQKTLDNEVADDYSNLDELDYEVAELLI